MPRVLTMILSLVVLVGILAASAGCERCDRKDFEESCDGDAQVLCVNAAE